MSLKQELQVEKSSKSASNLYALQHVLIIGYKQHFVIVLKSTHTYQNDTQVSVDE